MLNILYGLFSSHKTFSYAIYRHSYICIQKTSHPKSRPQINLSIFHFKVIAWTLINRKSLSINTVSLSLSTYATTSRHRSDTIGSVTAARSLKHTISALINYISTIITCLNSGWPSLSTHTLMANLRYIYICTRNAGGYRNRCILYVQCTCWQKHIV